MDLNKVINKVLSSLGLKRAKRGIPNASYFFNGSYPLIYAVDNPGNEAELNRRLNALKYILQARLSYAGGQTATGVKADFKTFPGTYIGKPNMLVVAVVLTFFGIDPETGRQIIYPDDIVRNMAMNFAPEVEDCLKMAGFKETILVPTPTSPQLLKELGFNIASFNTMKRIVLFDESYLLLQRVGGVNTPSPPNARPDWRNYPQQPQQPYPQQPFGTPQPDRISPFASGQGTTREPFETSGNWGSAGGSSSVEEVGFDFGDVDKSDLGDLIPDFEEEEGGVGGKTNEFLNKMQLYKVMEENGFDRETAEKYKLLDKAVLPDEMRQILEETVETFKKSGKPYYLLDIGKTIDGSKVYLPYAHESNNSVAIFGQAGFGKSVGALAIITELMFRGVPIVIFDVTGEWEILIKNLLEKVDKDEIARRYNNEGFKDVQLNVATIESFKDISDVNLSFQFPMKSLTMKELQTLMKVASEGASRSGGFGQHQQAVLISLQKKLQRGQLYNTDGEKIEDMGMLCDFFVYTPNDKIAELLGVPKDKEVIKAISSLKSVFMVISSREDVTAMYGTKRLNIAQIDRPNTVTIFRFPSMGQADKVEKAISIITVIKLLKDTYDFRISMYKKQGGTYTYPLHVFIEESHNFTNLEQLKNVVAETYAREVVTMVAKIIKEARKYGVSMMFASQDPSDVDSSILNQVPTVFFGSIPKKDAQYLQNLFNIDDELIEYALSMRNVYHEFLMFSSYYAKDRPILMKFHFRKNGLENE